MKATARTIRLEQHRRVGDETPSRAHRLDRVLARQGRGAHGDPRDHHRGDDRDERGSVDTEHERRARGGKQPAAERRADRPRQVLIHAAERDRRRPILLGHELGLERLPGRRGAGDAAADDEQQEQQDRGRRPPVAPSTASAAAATSIRICVARISLRRSNRSPSAPAGIARTSAGMLAAAWIAPINSADLVERDHHPLRGDRLHPRADVADELRRPQPAKGRRPQRPPAGSRGCGHPRHITGVGPLLSSPVELIFIIPCIAAGEPGSTKPGTCAGARKIPIASSAITVAPASLADERHGPGLLERDERRDHDHPRDAHHAEREQRRHQRPRAAEAPPPLRAPITSARWSGGSES